MHIKSIYHCKIAVNKIPQQKVECTLLQTYRDIELRQTSRNLNSRLFLNPQLG